MNYSSRFRSAFFRPFHDEHEAKYEKYQWRVTVRADSKKPAEEEEGNVWKCREIIQKENEKIFRQWRVKRALKLVNKRFLLPAGCGIVEVFLLSLNFCAETYCELEMKNRKRKTANLISMLDDARCSPYM